MRFFALILFMLFNWWTLFYCAEIPLGGSTNNIRVVSYNVLASFFDKEDYPHHTWAVREPFMMKVFENLSPDIIGLQELSPEQAIRFSELSQYESLFLIQSPCDFQAGTIAKGSEVLQWQGRCIGAPAVGILFKKDTFKLLDEGRFWFNDTPNQVPFQSRKFSDKGFGNITNYRGPIWVKLLHLLSETFLYVFNSHYPLSGTHCTRMLCSAVEREQIDLITQGEMWISMADRNIIPGEGEYRYGSYTHVLAPLLNGNYNAAKSPFHYGPKGTFAGFLFDEWKIPILDGQFLGCLDLDIIISNRPAVQSAHIMPVFDENLNTVELFPESYDESRKFVSDHMLVLGEYEL